LPVELDQRRAVVAVFETVPGLAERRQLVPTRPHVARPRDTMTLTLGLGVLVHCLLTHAASESTRKSFVKVLPNSFFYLLMQEYDI